MRNYFRSTTVRYIHTAETDTRQRHINLLADKPKVAQFVRLKPLNYV